VKFHKIHKIERAIEQTIRIKRIIHASPRGLSTMRRDPENLFRADCPSL
jgi:hypothetical protein